MNLGGSQDGRCTAARDERPIAACLAHIPRDGWLEAREKQAIIDCHRRFPLAGYRRLTSMVPDQDIVAVSPTSVYRVLNGAGLLDRNRWAPSKKATGLVQPLKAHDPWLPGTSTSRTSTSPAGTLQSEEFRDKAPRDLEEARRVVGQFATHYNEVRLHSALGYVTPHDKLAGRDAEIFDSRDSKREAARAKRLGAKSHAESAPRR